MSCLVEYDTAEEARQALISAGNFCRMSFLVKYAVEDGSDNRNTEAWIDPEVQSELEAMGNSYNYSNEFNGTFPRTAINQPLLNSNLTINKESKTTNLSLSSFNGPKVIKVPQNSLMNSNSAEQLANVDITLYQDLAAILRKPANSNEEKYRILDARDKLIRLTMVKQTDIKKVVTTKGTCPDMCPEKERLMREFQRQVRNDRIVMNYRIIYYFDMTYIYIYI